jgi:hypothetical protein
MLYLSKCFSKQRNPDLSQKQKKTNPPKKRQKKNTTPTQFQKTCDETPTVTLKGSMDRSMDRCGASHRAANTHYPTPDSKS